uniref:Thymidylate kinase-like domain-containing protein n=1 Tax=uncultured Nocardioidaceae bacterium TaxID=253824 RepID=A0A6J4MNP8_9ACTN|nr:MAG: hypothetical protein AVDCRST_MAG46-3593 [uncultured Nocardioidaceae bacterium]
MLLDVDPRTGTSRFAHRDRLEAEPVHFHDRVRQGFLELAAADPARYLVLDAADEIDRIADRIRAAVESLLDRRPA